MNGYILIIPFEDAIKKGCPPSLLKKWPVNLPKENLEDPDVPATPTNISPLELFQQIRKRGFNRTWDYYRIEHVEGSPPIKDSENPTHYVIKVNNMPVRGLFDICEKAKGRGKKMERTAMCEDDFRRYMKTGELPDYS